MNLNLNIDHTISMLLMDSPLPTSGMSQASQVRRTMLELSKVLIASCPQLPDSEVKNPFMACILSLSTSFSLDVAFAAQLNLEANALVILY